MYVASLRVEGLAHAPEYNAELDRFAALPRGAAGAAVADALSLLFAGLGAPGLAETLRRVELGRDVEVDVEEGRPVHVRGLDPDGVRALVVEGATRHLAVTAVIKPDPPLFGALRSFAAREPRLVSGLSEDPSITVTVGWLFSRDATSATVDLVKLLVGDVAATLTGPQRSAWVPELVKRMASRLGQVDPAETPRSVGARLLAASLSSEPEVRARYARAATAFDSSPFDLGRLELVRDAAGVLPCFGSELVRARVLGPAARHALQLVEGAIVRGPDILVVEAPSCHESADGAMRTWLEGCIDGEGATLEQVLVLGESLA